MSVSSDRQFIDNINQAVEACALEDATYQMVIHLEHKIHPKIKKGVRIIIVPEDMSSSPQGS